MWSGKLKPYWVIIGLIAVVLAFLAGLFLSNPETENVVRATEPEIPTPSVPKPLTTPEPPPRTAQQRQQPTGPTPVSTFVPVEVTPCPFRYRCFTNERGNITDSRDFGPHNMGGPLYLRDRDIQLPDDVYLADQIDKVTCRVPGCGIAPIYKLVRGESKIYIDSTGAAPPGWPNEGDQSVFDFLFEEQQ